MSDLNKQSLELKHFECARDMIRALRVTDPPWERRYLRPYQWGFRGQENSEWELVPSALRKGVVLGFSSDDYTHVSEGRGGCQRQLNGEFVVVQQFLEAADRIGLSVPGDHPFFRLHEGAPHHPMGSAIGTAEWPRTDMLELLAVAQHHGIPTRLLDLTYLPLVALYFAAASAIANGDSYAGADARCIAVWGIDLNLLATSNRIQIVRVPKSRNSFLRAQQGFFIFDPWASHARDTEETPSINRRIEGLSSTGDTLSQRPEPQLIKYTVPFDAADELLYLLSLERVDMPHLMPTFDNVVRFLAKGRLAMRPNYRASELAE